MDGIGIWWSRTGSNRRPPECHFRVCLGTYADISRFNILPPSGFVPIRLKIASWTNFRHLFRIAFWAEVAALIEACHGASGMYSCERLVRVGPPTIHSL